MNQRRPTAAFTLIELLTVIAIIGIIAAIVGPTLKNFRKGDTIAATTRQLQDDVQRARQFAISQRSTVYMVFLPTDFWTLPGWNQLSAAEKNRATNLLDKQLVGYNFVSVRTVGDQPGRNKPHYLSEWRALPEGMFVAAQKFNITQPNTLAMVITDPVSGRQYPILPFSTNAVPFPDDTANSLVIMPSIGFNYLGQLVSGRDEYIPLSHGSVLPSAGFNPPSVQESPAGNTSNTYNIIHIDWLTGRARSEHQEVQ